MAFAQESSKGSVNNLNSVRGYQGIFEIGYSAGHGEYRIKDLKLNFINSYKFSPFFSLGLGIGYNIQRDYYYRYGQLERSSDDFLTVFLDFRATFMNKGVSPYLDVKIGRSFTVGIWGSKNYGLLLNPSAGLRLKVSDKSAIIVGISYDRQAMPLADIINSLGINIGFSF